MTDDAEPLEEWQLCWPEHAEEIEEAAEALALALNSLMGTGADSMSYVAATEWAVRYLRSMITAEIAGELRFGLFEDEGEDDD